MLAFMIRSKWGKPSPLSSERITSCLHILDPVGNSLPSLVSHFLSHCFSAATYLPSLNSALLPQFSQAGQFYKQCPHHLQTASLLLCSSDSLTSFSSYLKAHLSQAYDSYLSRGKKNTTAKKFKSNTSPTLPFSSVSIIILDI